MARWFKPVHSSARRLLRTRPAAIPLLACTGGGLLSLAVGIAGATIAAGAAADLAGELIGGGLTAPVILDGASGGGGRGDRGGAWAGLATGMVLCVLGGGATLSFVAAGVPHDISVDRETGDVLIHRHPLRNLRIPRRHLRHVRVTGRTNRSGRPVLIVRLAARGRRVPILVDGGRDMDRLLARVRGHAEGLAEVLGLPLVLEGWARDPGHDPGTGRGPDRESSYD
jgi:hypothetical protein